MGPTPPQVLAGQRWLEENPDLFHLKVKQLLSSGCKSVNFKDELLLSEFLNKANGHRGLESERTLAEAALYLLALQSQPKVTKPQPGLLVDDLPGNATRPDPLQFRTPEAFLAGMRRFWEWNGEPSSRKLAKFSDGVFSHATIAALLAENPSRRPPVKLEYVQAFIRACGGDAEEVARWTCAWRRAFKGFVPAEQDQAVPSRSLRAVADG